MAVGTKGVVWPLSTRWVWGQAPRKKFEIQKLENAISSILGIKKSVLYDDFY